MTWKTWLITSLVFIIIEILPPPTHFFFLCLALGAVGAAIAAFFAPDTAWVSWAVFAVVSAASVPLLVPLAKFLFTPKDLPTNVDEVIGQKALVIERIDPKQAGVVKVKGEEWRALSDETIEKDSWVEVIRVEGAHVIVRRIS
jgi:membrane protein implicated in regulation of membrane protease activity